MGCAARLKHLVVVASHVGLVGELFLCQACLVSKIAKPIAESNRKRSLQSGLIFGHQMNLAEQ